MSTKKQFSISPSINDTEQILQDLFDCDLIDGTDFILHIAPEDDLPNKITAISNEAISILKNYK